MGMVEEEIRGCPNSTCLNLPPYPINTHRGQENAPTEASMFNPGAPMVENQRNQANKAEEEKDID